MTWSRPTAFGIAVALALATGPLDAASEEKPTVAAPAAQGPGPEQKNAQPSYEATAKRSEQTAQRLGLDLTSDAPLAVDARSAEMLEDGKGGESLRFKGDVKLTQGELKLTCDRLDAFFPQGRGEGRPQKIVASGDVQVVKGEFELRCTRVTFEDASCVAVCLSSETCQSGKWPDQPARFRRGKDWIEGRELEFNQCTGKMFARCGARLSVTPKEEGPKQDGTAATNPPATSAKPEAPATAKPEKPAPPADAAPAKPTVDTP